MTFEWWWIAAGFGVFGAIFLFRPAHGPLWPFLLLVPALLITAHFATLAPHPDALGAFLAQDGVFQILLAVRFACAILMIALASGRRFPATMLVLAALLADPVLFNFGACAFGAPLCR